MSNATTNHRHTAADRTKAARIVARCKPQLNERVSTAQTGVTMAMISVVEQNLSVDPGKVQRLLEPLAQAMAALEEIETDMACELGWALSVVSAEVSR